MAIQNKSRADRGGVVTVSFSDSIALVKEQVHWSPRGVSLLTKWPFRVGAEVEFAFDHRGERHCCTGVVVECHPSSEPAGYYQTVLYFVETPCSKLQKAACACKLARENELAANEANMVETPESAERVASRGRSGVKAG